MKISFSDRGFFRIISDGDRLVLLRGGGKDRQCFLIDRPFLVRYDLSMDSPYHEFRSMDGSVERFSKGYTDLTIDLSIKGREIENINRPLVMGVDIFNKLSVSDYLDIINEKIKIR